MKSAILHSNDGSIYFLEEAPALEEGDNLTVAEILEDEDSLWMDDTIQFARLIAEIEAVGGFTVDLLADLGDSMDLDAGNIYKLIDRAQRKFDRVKESL